jgi:hypothetical protein
MSLKIKIGEIKMNHEKSTEHSMEHTSMHCGSMPEVWKCLNEEQKKKVVLMKLDMKILWLEKKIKDMESEIELKRRAIGDLKQVQEMIKSKK